MPLTRGSLILTLEKFKDFPLTHKKRERFRAKSLPFFRHLRNGLFGSEYSVAGIAKAREDVGVFV